jgi:hypothetical protein
MSDQKLPPANVVVFGLLFAGVGWLEIKGIVYLSVLLHKPLGQYLRQMSSLGEVVFGAVAILVTGSIAFFVQNKLKRWYNSRFSPPA